MQDFFMICDGNKLVIVPGNTHCFDYHLEMMSDAVKDILAELEWAKVPAGIVQFPNMIAITLLINRSSHELESSENSLLSPIT